jgi:hypothetical protein
MLLTELTPIRLKIFNSHSIFLARNKLWLAGLLGNPAAVLGSMPSNTLPGRSFLAQRLCGALLPADAELRGTADYVKQAP